jgi:hypothetical protein
MCHEIKCSKCKKLTWSGCGNHLENLFAKIQYNQRCWCNYEIDVAQINILIKQHQAIGSSGPFPKK